MISRRDAIASLAADEFDVVVVGGGITGAGVALDAASRGYSVALVERNDFASGTSSRSSKLVHGGLRYLQQFDVGLVREALLERQLMVALAPHLVHPLPIVVPAFDGERPDRLVGIGLNMYDVLSMDTLRRRGRRGKAEDADGDGPADWAPERHRSIGGDEVDSNAVDSIVRPGWRLVPFQHYPGTSDTYQVVIDGQRHSDMWRTGSPEVQTFVATEILDFMRVYVAGDTTVDVCTIGVGDLSITTLDRRPADGGDTALAACA